MTEKFKARVEIIFRDIDERLGHCPLMSSTDKRQEIKKIEAMVADLENELQRFQMTASAKDQDTCELLEERLVDLTSKIKQLSKIDYYNPSHVDHKVCEVDQVGPSQMNVLEAESKLNESKSRAQAMLHTVNNLREEINLIDDEIMIQREKLLIVNEKLKDTQSVLKQSKRLVIFFSKAVYDDVFIKLMIGLIAVTLIVVFIMCINIKIKKVQLKDERIAKAKEEEKARKKALQILNDENKQKNCGKTDPSVLPASKPDGHHLLPDKQFAE
jgi:hypothetical protein